ncbi:MAG: hypothetical protein QM704_22040 [Anaeromyxobacteraceae bacterium]
MLDSVRHASPFLCALLLACGAATAPPDPACAGVACSGHGTCAAVGGAPTCRCDPGWARDGATACVASQVPSVGGCPLLPADHVFNTPVDGLPVHPSSAAFMATLGAHTVHLDLGQTTDPRSDTYYGIPYNVVHGGALTWSAVAFHTADTSMTWDPRDESDCAAGPTHAIVSPCTAAAAPAPLFPVPAAPLVEGGLVTDPAQPYGDHHLLVVDADACRLWEAYHVYPRAGGGWDLFGIATFDLASNALRPRGWTSADAAGFPILPLLLRADEAASGEIRHALRFTIPSDQIRVAYTWPARHLTSNGTGSASLPPMGQPFRLKASFAIPAGWSTQSRAIAQAMKTYGLYLADGGSALYVQGEPSAAWDDRIFGEVQSIPSSAFEAVDLGPWTARAGFDPDSARVPPP